MYCLGYLTQFHASKWGLLRNQKLERKKKQYMLLMGPNYCHEKGWRVQLQSVLTMDPTFHFWIHSMRKIGKLDDNKLGPFPGALFKWLKSNEPGAHIQPNKGSGPYILTGLVHWAHTHLGHTWFHWHPKIIYDSPSDSRSQNDHHHHVETARHRE